MVGLQDLPDISSEPGAAGAAAAEESPPVDSVAGQQKHGHTGSKHVQPCPSQHGGKEG